jgi:rubrerythrin
MNLLVGKVTTVAAGRPADLDPDRLPDLIELARRGLEPEVQRRLPELLLSMKERVAAAWYARRRDFLPHRARYDDELVALVEENLQAYLEVEAELQAVLESLQARDHKRLLQAVESLRQATDLLQETSEELVDLHACGDLICPCCGMPCEVSLCPGCEREGFYPDPDGQAGPTGYVSLPPAYRAVFTVMTRLLRGEVRLPELMTALDSVQAPLWQARLMVAKALAEKPEEQRALAVKVHLDGCLEGVARMRNLGQSRKLRDLNVGWTMLVEHSVKLAGCFACAPHRGF